MSLVNEATARFHKLIESEPYIDLAWAHALQERIKSEKLDGRPVSPVLRPHLITQKDYASLVRASETLLSAIARVEKLALETPALLGRMQLLPAEKMLATVDPGYSTVGITALLDAAVHDGSIRITSFSAEAPAGVLYGDALSDLYYEAPPVKQFRKKYKLQKMGGAKHLLGGLLKTYKEFGGKQKKPNIAILEFKAPFAAASSDHALLAGFFAREGY